MTGSKKKAVALLAVMTLILSGCGDTPIALTQEEEATIVHYVAHIVGKFNSRQSKGVIALAPEDETMLSDEQATEHATEQETEQTSDGGDGTTEETPEEPVLTLNQIIGIDGIEASYTGAELKDSYVDEDYFALNPTVGNNFVILHISLTNTTDQAINCDFLSRQLVFKADINETVQTTAMTTILLNDLGTYQGMIEAGSSVETVLLFEVSAEQVVSVDRISLELVENGTSVRTNL